MSSPPFDTYDNLPPVADDAAAAVGLARWHETADDVRDANLAVFMRDLAADSAGRRLLTTLFGNSPYLANCCFRESALLARLWRQGVAATFAELISRLNRDLTPTMPQEALAAELRRLKRGAALTIAIADIAGLWPLTQTMEALSRFAEDALALATRHLLHAAAARGLLALRHADDPARDSGFVVLAMGKLGASELNYSSDIDLVVVFDPEKARIIGDTDSQTLFSRMTQDLVRVMAERTDEGYVFRTDLRLRPDPGSTPPALSLPAALAYYESAGQNWERAALIRARPVAGDRDAGREFLAALTPFLWRKYLDFAAIQDIHSIKRQIHAHRGGAAVAVAGHNVKLGRGGIREIEFFAQTQQLIWGGREPDLRQRQTVPALEALAAAGHISRQAADDLAEAYAFLRRVEHRLQMIDDAQTHTIPADTDGIRHLALFLGYATADAFAADLTRQLTIVESHYANLFEEAPSLAAPGNLVFTGTDDDPETLRTLTALGFADPGGVAGIVRAWHHGRYRATRSQRARELLTELVPALLRSFGASAAPDAALIRFDHFLGRLPAGVQSFSLLHQNPGLLDLVAEIMSAAPTLAETMMNRPGVLDAVLAAGFFEPLPPCAALTADVGQLLDRARHAEEMLDLARRWVAERKFQVGVQALRRRLDGEAAGGAFADIAEAALAALLPRVAAEFARTNGTIAGGAVAVLGLGKLGSREMTYASDLDLILIYDAPDDAESTGGAQPLAAPTYYARLSQRFINALTAATAEGRLYDVDMRLRPSGTAGPVATSLQAFRRYHRELAWTWEQMALTRARPVVGDGAFVAHVMAEIRSVLVRPRSTPELANEVVAMRRRIADTHRNPSAFDVKHRPGGLIDIEFIAQFLQLRDAAQTPQILHANTRSALTALVVAGALTHGDCEILIHALTLWRNVQGLLKLTVREPFDEAATPPTVKDLIAHGAAAIDFDALKQDMETAARAAHGLFRRLVETAAVKMAEERAP
ncbi:MAG: bifunctional [glutamine synthetase] adenylyltransferase/[glutamine synthetase]-adenylyl-L-tyrosine phosphorylase [Alphaproteobacteria bacterium]|nr:bifunctional [glutamine synthetase] adenylyltransferase/[glutamine synthetase]-adenylyl-L-tyrosine phosphorylase [Alphaproteobacteria bacterium]